MRIVFAGILLLLVLSNCRRQPSSDSFQASTDAAAYMEAFEGRGALTDGSVPLPPDEALKRFEFPEDIAVDLLASEPLVEQPVELNFDQRGRLWVVQYKQYPYPKGLQVTDVDWHMRVQFDSVPEPPPAGVRGADTISLLEDTDGDGVFDSTVDAIQGLNIATSVTWGRGRIWVLNPPYLLAYPDPDGDGLPDGDPVVHLSGFGLEDTHAVANSLRWGPDGWLYGAQGSTTTATVTARNSPDVHFEGQAIWRYHPEREVFELFAEGGGNTFHVEFDDKGRLYSGHNGGEARGQYYKQGGYYVKNWGKHGPLTNPYALGYLDHMAHSGETVRFTHAFIRYGGAGMPERYQDALIGINPLQNFVQVSRFEPEGSSFKTVDVERLLVTGDRWFRPVDIKEGPDGAVYLADWYDSRLSHADPRDTWHKNSGRIYRIRGLEPAPVERFDFGAASNQGLLEALRHENRWRRQQALRQFGDRKDPEVIPQLESLLFEETGQTALEALWALNLSGGFRETVAFEALKHPDPFVRMWTVRLLSDDLDLEPSMAEALQTMAERESHPEVRSQLASSSKRWASPAALEILRELTSHAEDRDDPHIPLLIWWAFEAHIGRHPEEVARLFEEADLWDQPIVQETLLGRIMQRAVRTGASADYSLAARLFELAPSAEASRPLVEGFQEGLRGASLSTLPFELVMRYQQDAETLGEPAYALGLRRGDETASARAIEIIEDEDRAMYERLAYIRVLEEVPRDEVVPVLLHIVRDDASPALRQAALDALRRYDRPDVGEQVLAWYPDRLRADRELREAALELLIGRAEWARGLIDAIERTRRIDREDVPLHLARQMQFLNDEGLKRDVERIWPVLQVAASEEKQNRIEEIRSIVETAPGDVGSGKGVFDQVCGSCHRLFDEGGALGPDLTGYERRNLDAMLLHIIDPSAEIREGYVNYSIVTVDGNTWSGFLNGRRGAAVELRSFSGEITVLAESEIASMMAQPVSLMPEGLLRSLSDEQIRDLFAYLMR